MSRCSTPRGSVRRRVVAAVAVVAAVIIAVAPATGCKSSGGGGGSGGDSAHASGKTNGTRTATPTVSATGAEMRVQAMAAADGYVIAVAQALDELRDSTRVRRPDVAAWALQHKIATAGAAFTNATGTGDAASLIDMMVLARLKRIAVEEHWVPNYLHEDGKGLLDAHRRAEIDVWSLGAKALTPKQIEELGSLIEQWRLEHPGQYYVGYVRISDIAAEKQLTKQSAQLKMPGSVFGLLYMDPLSGLDPVAAELHSYRALTERMVFLVTRMPNILAAQVERATDDATSTPQVLRFLDGIDSFNKATSRFTDNTSRFTDNTGRFADSIKRFTEVAAKYPEQLSAERVAAIEQANGAVTEQRKAILAELDTQESRLRRVMDDVKGVLDRADKAGLSINNATTQTVTTTEQATRRTMDRAFWLAAGLILLLLIGIPTSALVYRSIAHRDSRHDRSVPSAS